jgi:hypothetical protein
MKIILNNKLKMEHCQEAFMIKEKNDELIKAIFNISNDIEGIGNFKKTNFNCKFKLKKNRKIGVLLKNKILKENNIPPMAPLNTTQYLSKIREEDPIQIFQEKYSNNWEREQKDKENILTLQLNTENKFIDINNSLRERPISITLNDEREGEKEYGPLSGNEFYMGSTMKSIVESITKSKSKIFSKSLILDGENLTQKINESHFKNSHICENQSDLQKLNFTISDFLPEVDQDSIENPIEDTFYLNNITRNENNFFSLDDNNLFPIEEHLEKSTNISLHSKPFLVYETSNENEDQSSIIQEEFFLLGKKKERIFKEDKEQKPFFAFRL